MMFLALLAPAFAAAPPPIVNGTKTSDYPEVVLLRHTTADGSVAFICSGTLVTPDTVLTAAHCLSDVQGYDLTDIRVSSGAAWTADVPERLATGWLSHPDYSVSADGLEIKADLGLVFLGEPFELDGIVLNADAVTEADVDTKFRYVGWGASSDTAHDQGYFKRVADIPLSALEGEFLLGYDGETGSATCGGDSGGAVFELDHGAAGALAGVHSFGRDDDGTICAGSISGDTRVDLYADWIVAEVPAITDTSPQDTGEGDTGAAGGDEADAPGRGESAEAPAGCASGAGPSWLGVCGLLILARGRRNSR